MPPGEAHTYTPEIGRAICEQLATGKTLREVCRGEGMPPESTVRLWALDDREGFAAQYARAREIGYHAMADDLIEIADDGRNDWMYRNADDNEGWTANGEHLQRSRLRVDTRKWMLSKALPKVYGDKLELSGGLDVTTQTKEQRDAAVAAATRADT
jgi:hypothetical protein